jgi:hypothetical protein
MKQLKNGFAPIVVILISLVLIAAGGLIFYELKKPTNFLPEESSSFIYKDGFKFWENPIDPKINTTFSQAVDAGIIKPCTADRGESTDISEQINSECRKAPGRIAIVNQGDIFVMPEDQGYYTRNMRDSRAYPQNFYYPNYPTSGEFLLIPFDGYYVPSYYDVPNDFLISWKKQFIEATNMPESEFANKVKVVGVSLGGNNKYATRAYYVDDWVQVSIDGDSKVNWQDKVISKSELESLVDDYKYPLEFNVNNLRINHLSGDIYMEIGGEIDLKNNKCVDGVVNLSTGNLQANEGACFIVENW